MRTELDLLQHHLRHLLPEQRRRVQLLEPGLLRAGLGAAFYKDDGSGRAEALNEMLHELVADGTVAAILESYGVDAQAALAGLIHGQ